MMAYSRQGLLFHSLQAQNLLRGTIPDMSNLNKLQLMDLAGNRLEGSLPTFWASSLQLEYFSVQNNLLTGSVPTTRIPFKLRGDHDLVMQSLTYVTHSARQWHHAKVTLLCLYIE